VGGSAAHLERNTEMSLLGFLTGVGSLFGSGSTGKSSTTQSSSGTSNSEQAATTDTSLNGTVTSNQSSTGNQNTTGTSAANQATTGKESSATTGTTTNYSSDVLASLDALLTSSLGNGAAQKATDTLSGRLDQLKASAAQPAFDVNGYVSGIAQAATSATQSDLDSRINSILSATGSSEGGNSMSALLGNKLRNEASANLAGVISNANIAGNEMAQKQQESLTSQMSGVSNDISTQLAQLLSAAKGGTQQTTGAANTVSTQNQASTGSTTQNTAETATQNQTQTEKSDQTQSGVTQTQGTTTSTTKASTKTNDGKTLFDKILSGLGSSSAAA
jgi:hypothetical protein